MTKFFNNCAYFETKTKESQYRVWANPGQPRKKIEAGGSATWFAVMDDFGNLVWRK